MPTPTYMPLANTTLGSNVSSVTFSSISQAYRDLVLVAQIKSDVTSGIYLRVNSLTGIYNYVYMAGNGSTSSSAASDGMTNLLPIGGNSLLNSTNFSTIELEFMDYTATDKYKNVLAKMGRSDYVAFASVSRGNTTSAINSIYLFGDSQFAAGSTFALYGIAA